MNYKTEINGIEVNVDYTNDNIENIFIPILKYAKKLYEEKKKRVLVMLAAPPGAGKSTLLSFFKYLSENNNELMPKTTKILENKKEIPNRAWWVTAMTVEKKNQSFL